MKIKRASCHSPHQAVKEMKEMVMKERKATDFGHLRLAYLMRKKHGFLLSAFPRGSFKDTIRDILRRHKLTKHKKRRTSLLSNQLTD